MSKLKKRYEPLTAENKKFLTEQGLKLSDIAEMLNMKTQSLRMSSAKNRYINFLSAFCKRIGV